MGPRNDLEKLIEYLPIYIQKQLSNHQSKENLIEVILDLGKRPEARFSNKLEYLSPKIISWQDLEYTTTHLSKFNNENRAGINRTLHRISCIRNRQFLINGLTCRIGRTIFGTVSLIRDLLERQQSILILGKPGVGKTTIIREIARIFADELEKRVIIVDTSNEIAGDSDIPHLAVGKARVMKVSQTNLQHQIMIEAVENHMPQIIIIDEISTELEVLAARTIAEKGVQLIGTTHGTYLENLIKNPFLSDLIGGIEYVVLSDEEAKRRGTQKSILERKIYPTFETMIEMRKQNSWIIYEDVQMAIDLFLQNGNDFKQMRKCLTNDKIKIQCQNSKIRTNELFNSQIHSTKSLSFFNKNWSLVNKSSFQNNTNAISQMPLVVYPYSISLNLLKEVLLKLGIKFNFTNDIKNATIVIGVKKQLKNNLKLVQLAKQRKISIYMVSEISVFQLIKLMKKHIIR